MNRPFPENSLINLVKAIVQLPTAPFHEKVVLEWLETWARKLPAGKARVRVSRDKYGNLLVRYRHPDAKTPVAFAAHTDHPSFEIKEWISKTSVKTEFLGGVLKEYFKKGVGVELFSETGQKLGRAQIARVLDWKTKLVELRLTSKKQFARDQARFGMWALKGFRQRGSLLEARVCDDLMGVVAICAALEQIAREKAVADVTAVFSRAEEVGFVGAMGVVKAKSLPANCTVISIENSKALAEARIGDGPIIRVGDRSSVFDPRVTAGLKACGESLAKKNKKFIYQRRLMDGGSCEGTAYKIHNYKTGAMCLPLGNYHNMAKSGKIACEYVHLRDLQGLILLIIQYSKEVGAQIAEKELEKRLEEIWDKSMRKLLNHKN